MYVLSTNDALGLMGHFLDTFAQYQGDGSFFGMFYGSIER